CQNPRSEAVHALGELAEGGFTRVVNERDLARATGAEIALDQIVGGVAVAGNMDLRRADRVVSGAERRHDRLPFLISSGCKPGCDIAKSSRRSTRRRLPRAWCRRSHRAT